MAPLRSMLRGFRGVLRPNAVNRDIDDEVRHFVEESAAARISPTCGICLLCEGSTAFNRG
jgi:hypothetical protein